MIVRILDRVCFLVCSGCCKILQTGWFKEQTVISHNSGGWEVQGQGTCRSRVWLETASWYRLHHLPVSLHSRKRARSPLRSLLEALSPFMRLHPCKLVSTNIITLEFRISACVNLGTQLVHDNLSWGDSHVMHYILLSKWLLSTDYVCSCLTLLKRHKGMVLVLRLILLATCKWKGLNL